MKSYKQFIGLDMPAPDSANPSLWRNAQLNIQYGLFKVTDGIYQVRGYYLSNVTFIEGKTAWIVFDPLLSAGPAAGKNVVITVEGLLQALLRGKLSARQAVDAGLLQLDTTPQQAQLWQTAFGAAN